VIDLAIRSAIEKRGVAHITIPIDVQQQSAKAEKSQRNALHHSSSINAISGNVPSPAILRPLQKFSTMACGMPYAIAAQIAFPHRQVIGVIGDGGFTMLMGEIITAVAYKLPIKLDIIKNNTLGQIKWEQMVFQGNPEYQCDLFPIDFVALAKAVGANGVRIDDPRTAGTKFDEALAMPGPVIIEAVVDQFTAMLPAKITADQALKFSEALAKGEPNRIKIALTAARDTVRQIV
jgi:pyruvate dehydrogenase (quinone)